MCVCAYLGLLSLLEESLLAGPLLGLVGGEVLGLRDLLDLLLVEARDVDLVRGGDDVAGVDPAQRNAVDLEGAGNEEDTLVEGLEENDTLAAEATGEDDQDGTGLQGLARGPGADGLADLFSYTLSVPPFKRTESGSLRRFRCALAFPPLAYAVVEGSWKLFPPVACIIS
mgnify:CR=1 FL=1